MSRQPNYFNIGIFVIIAVLLITAGVIIFGTGDVGTKTVYYESYFDESVQGLTVGSPLKYRGVDIGKVDRIELASKVYQDQIEDNDFSEYGKYVRVVLAVDSSKAPKSLCVEKGFEDNGLRVRLTAQGITGLAFLDVDYFDSDHRETLHYPWQPEYPCIASKASVINTFLTQLENTMDEISRIPFTQIANNLDNLMVDIDIAVKSLDFGKLNTNTLDLIFEMKQASADAKDLIHNVSQKLDQVDIASISDSSKELLNSMIARSNQLEHTFNTVDKICLKVDGILENDSADITTIPEFPCQMNEYILTN